MPEGLPLLPDLPALPSVSREIDASPRVPMFDAVNSTCAACSGELSTDIALALSAPEHRAGGNAVDLYSGNVPWRHQIIDVPGRAKSRLKLELAYNSMVWTRSAKSLAFNADAGFPAPGFHLGLPTLHGRLHDQVQDQDFYVLVQPNGGRTELRRVGRTEVFEATDESLLQLLEVAPDSTTIRGVDGSRWVFHAIGKDRQVNVRQVDAHGNYIEASYDAKGFLKTIVDTVGRRVQFQYDESRNLTRITEGASGRILASFGYRQSRVSLPGQMASVEGWRDSDFAMLSHLGLSDGTSYGFTYTTFGQLARVSRFAPNGRLLSSLSYQYGRVDSPFGNPRPVSASSWVAGAETADDCPVIFSYDAATATGGVARPDGSTALERYATSGAERGQPVRLERRDALRNFDFTDIAWQVSEAGPGVFRVVKKRQETQKLSPEDGESGTLVEFNADGLPASILMTGMDGTAVQRRAITYVDDAAYLGQHRLGLVARHDVLDLTTGRRSSVDFVYDEPSRVSWESQPSIKIRRR